MERCVQAHEKKALEYCHALLHVCSTLDFTEESMPEWMIPNV